MIRVKGIDVIMGGGMVQDNLNDLGQGRGQGRPKYPIARSVTWDR